MYEQRNIVTRSRKHCCHENKKIRSLSVLCTYGAVNNVINIEIHVGAMEA